MIKCKIPSRYQNREFIEINTLLPIISECIFASKILIPFVDDVIANL